MRHLGANYKWRSTGTGSPCWSLFSAEIGRIMKIVKMAAKKQYGTVRWYVYIARRSTPTAFRRSKMRKKSFQSNLQKSNYHQNAHYYNQHILLILPLILGLKSLFSKKIKLILTFRCLFSDRFQWLNWNETKLTKIRKNVRRTFDVKPRS